MLAAAVSGLARAHGWTAANDRPITAHNVWAALAYRDLALPRTIRRLLRDHVLFGTAVWEMAAWQTFMEALIPFFSPPPLGAEGDIVAFCAFVVFRRGKRTPLEG